MLTTLQASLDLRTTLQPIVYYLQRPVRLLRTYDRANLRPDLVAGLTVAVILLPQAIVFALIADLPPQMGLYAAIIGAFMGALWGSSNQAHTGPTNAISLLVLSALSNTAVSGNQFILAAGLMAVMVGVFQLVVGLARLGLLVNFVSHSVIVGFASGAGVLIAIKQLNPLLGVTFPSESPFAALGGIVTHLSEAHWATVGLGIGTMVLIVILRKINPKLPTALISMVIASLVVFLFRLDESGVAVIGQLTSSFPPLADLPLFDLELIGRLSTGALAIGAIGLVQTMAIARSAATQTGQRLDSNQEFVGQGLSNIFAGFFSGYPCAASFSRTAVNLEVGAKTPLSAVFSSIFVLVAIFVLAPLTAFLPRAALAGVLIITAYSMIDRAEIARIWRGTRGDAAIMVVTFLGTLLLEIEFAVLTGILFSFALYIMRTSTPRVQAVLPDHNFKHFTYQPDKDPCPQLAIIDILGDLYFGAVNHVEETILAYAEQHPGQRFLLLRMHSVNICDFSGIHMLENVVRTYRDRGGDVFLVRVSAPVQKLMASTHFDKHLGADHFLADDEAISQIFHHVLDPAICIYECPVRAFRECQNLPKQTTYLNLPGGTVFPESRIVNVTPKQLWRRLHNGQDEKPEPFVVDVREPREYQRGHIPEAELMPLPTLLEGKGRFPNDRQIIFVCRSGRRSRRAAHALRQIGCTNVAVLKGGMQNWESKGLLRAIEK